MTTDRCVYVPIDWDQDDSVHISWLAKHMLDFHHGYEGFGTVSEQHEDRKVVHTADHDNLYGEMVGHTHDLYVVDEEPLP